MPLIAGDPACTIGLSKRIRDGLLASDSGAIDNAALRALSYAIASAVVEEIVANSTLLGTAPPGGGPIAGSVT